ncbi:FAD-binding oxidoreductase [Paludibacterium denitrificans]|uniref:FAD-binding oxidoreductase n=1 Tax=Paludibacterium denitrificans TaxID=2675226 RepID=UPI0024782B2E|nr:FAD-linked oxidase C-terminal domain-containing protein [Paludibacterium denitrificans]
MAEQLVQWLAERDMVDGVVAKNEAERQQLWQLREAMSETQKRDGPSIKHDIAVPTSAIPAFVEHCETALRAAFPSVRIMAFGHAGDGNLHYNISYTRPDNADLFADEARVNAIVYDTVYQFA